MGVQVIYGETAKESVSYKWLNISWGNFLRVTISTLRNINWKEDLEIVREVTNKLEEEIKHNI